MSDNEPESHRSHGDDQDWDFEGEWEQARAASRGENAEISPYSLLYTGFFLGPAATFLAMIVVMGRRFDVRAALFTLGICGAAWSIAQGTTFGLHAQWSPLALQAVRTCINFVAGLLLLWFALRKGHIAFAHDRRTLVNTGIFLMLLIAVFSATSAETLFWLGR
jgi:hypothetical protein